MRDRFGIFGAVIRIRKLSLLLVMTLRMPNMKEEAKETEARWEEDTHTTSPQDGELTEVTLDNEPTE